MMFRAAIVFLALAVPAYAQHGGAHAGSIGGRGFSGPAGFSSHPAFSRPSFSQSPGFARSAPASRYGSFAGYRTYAQPGLRSPYYGNRFAARRPSYDPRGIGVSRSFDRDRGRNPIAIVSTDAGANSRTGSSTPMPIGPDTLICTIPTLTISPFTIGTRFR